MNSFSRCVAPLLLCCCLALSALWQADAAKKYYPPGYTPEPQPTPLPPVVQPVLSAPRQVAPTPRPKPKDPLTALLESQRYYEALRLVDQRIGKEPRNLYLRILRGQVLRHEENFQQAEEEYRDVLAKTNSKDLRARALQGLGMTQYFQAKQAKQLGDHYAADIIIAQAEASLKESLAILPRLPETWIGLAEVYLYKGRLKEAEESLKKASAYSPNNFLVLLTRGQLLLEQGKAEQALAQAYAARKIDDEDPRGYLLLGEVSLAMNKTDDAIIHFKRVLERVPDHTRALRLLSGAYEQKMKPEDAERTLQKVVSLNPLDSEATQALLALFDQKGDDERSLLLLKTLISKTVYTGGEPAAPQTLTLQILYQQQLMERLLKLNRYEEAFESGATFLDPLSDQMLEEHPGMEGLMSAFSRAAYFSGQGLMAPDRFFARPAVAKAMAYARRRVTANPASLSQRMNLLLLDPLEILPTLPAGHVPSAEELPQWIQMAFLTGDQQAHQALLVRLAKEQDPASALKTVETLWQFGDLSGAQALMTALPLDVQKEPATTELLANIARSREKAQSKVRVLELLPRKIPVDHWEVTAQEALRLSRANWKLHALVSDFLSSRKLYETALTHQKLAVRYAPSDREKKRWQRKVEKTASLLEKRADKH